MSDIILRVDNISKQYRLGLVGTGTLAHDLNRFWHKIRGKEDPYLRLGSVNDRSEVANSDYVWALRDINFEVKQGEILGIIGKNGAGKSTLLKILSRVTSPTTGSIKTKGRIASLLEVGTGMHPELTGMENIYLNGAILGMTKGEIRAKIDDIVDFSGCQMYIDTPVKRYSSGMRVRLGFAVAAFLEPDILVVDEVLAVGDAEFQKKAIGKMQDISNTNGRTVLFVSHNMASVKKLCSRAIVLNNGSINFDGKVEKAVESYLSINAKENINLNDFSGREGAGDVRIIDLKLFDSQLNKQITLKELKTQGDYIFELEIYNQSTFLKNVDIGLSIYTEDGYLLTANSSNYNITPILIKAKEKKSIQFKFSKFPFTHGSYILNLACSTPYGEIEDFIKDMIKFVVSKSTIGKKQVVEYPAKSLLINLDWNEL